MQEYCLGNSGAMIEINEGDESMNACAFVNPLTTIGLFSRVKDLK